jgi:ankyrin repeat protein
MTVHRLVTFNCDQVASLISHGGADPNAVNNFGMSSLHWAASVDDVIMMELLITAGASVNIKGAHDCTPLHFACRDECEAAVAMLLRCASVHSGNSSAWNQQIVMYQPNHQGAQSSWAKDLPIIELQVAAGMAQTPTCDAHKAAAQSRI